MLVIGVELLHGVIRAGSADDLARTGLPDPGEWPPSPARVFSALVAAGGSQERSLTGDDDMRALERAGAPTILADSRSSVTGSQLQQRFVVVNERADGAVQNYPARRSTAHRPGTRLVPVHPSVGYVWPDVTLSQEQLDGLALRAARVGYFGCADSPARLWVSTEVSAELTGLEEWAADADGDVSLPIPYPGFLGALDRAYAAFQAGQSPPRSRIPNPRQGYRDPDQRENQLPQPFISWLRLLTPISGRRVVALTSTVKGALLDQLGDDAPPLIHGHQTGEAPYELARFLALPEVGHAHSTGRIRGAAVWLPPDTPVDVRADVDVALNRIRRLRLPGGQGVGIERFDGVPQPAAVSPLRWTQVGRIWGSVFPVVFERYPKGVPSLTEIGRWCAHVGLPTPIAARVSEGPVVPGAVALSPVEAFRPGKARMPYAHMVLEFAEPVAGPLVLGKGRHLGLGLFTQIQRTVTP